MRLAGVALVLACSAATAQGTGELIDPRAPNDSLLIDDCAQLPALAARTPRNAPNAARLYFATGVCYLESPKLPRDTLAASLWLQRSADLGHEPARRLLLTLPPPAVGAPR